MRWTARDRFATALRADGPVLRRRHAAGAELARFVMALIHNSPRSAPATDLVGFYRGILDALARTLDAAVARGELRPGRRRPAPRVHGCLGEAMHGHLLVGRPTSTPALAETLVDTVLGGWAPRTPL